MKIGVISDIHGNIMALKTVLEEFKKRNVEKIICCGDIIGIGPHPEETVKKIMEYKDMLVAVRGNHEKYLLEGIPVVIHDDKRNLGEEEIENHKWIHNKISEESKKFLKSLPLEQKIEIENKKIYVVHYPMKDDGQYKRHIKCANQDENAELFSNIKADIFFYGHTHIALKNEKDNKLFVNPGSLGCPLETNYAYCGILDINNEKVGFEHLQLEYDADFVRKEIESIKYPFYKGILRLFFGKNY